MGVALFAVAEPALIDAGQGVDNLALEVPFHAEQSQGHVLVGMAVREFALIRRLGRPVAKLGTDRGVNLALQVATDMLQPRATCPRVVPEDESSRLLSTWVCSYL